jgi:tol-pal system protein YbgF
VSFGFLLTGCLATTQEIDDLRVDIARLQQSLAKAEQKQGEYLTSLQGNQADLLTQTTALNSRIEALTARLEESDKRMDDLAVRLDDLDKNFSGRLDLLTEGVGNAKKAAAVAPSKLYQLAYDDFMKRHYAQSLKEFQDFVQVYPDNAQAADAQFYVGECRFARKEWKQALAAYDAVIVSHAVSSIVPSAILQKGAVLEKMGEKTAALDMYETLVKKFPDKPEAESAKARVEALRKPPPPAPKAPAVSSPEATAPKAVPILTNKKTGKPKRRAPSPKPID